MQIQWTSKASSDLVRLYEFLKVVNPPAAARIVQSLTKHPNRLLVNPRIGEPLEEFSPRDVRHILIDKYELRYEIQEGTLYILRIWHTREHR